METNTLQEIDIHRLIMRFDHTRVMEPEAIGRLRYSIERFGQLSPVIVNLEGTKDLILMDGYKRVQAIKGCCKDTVLAEIWNTDEHTALLRLFSENQLKNSELIEESLMLRELQNRYKLSMRQIAQNIGRDVAWVSRRLDMAGQSHQKYIRNQDFILSYLLSHAFSNTTFIFTKRNIKNPITEFSILL
jgi:ParB-like chromosome segregation protein Spo0J